MSVSTGLARLIAVLTASSTPDLSGGPGLRALIWSDYAAHYAYKAETRRRLKLLFAPRLLTNASLHATTLIRLNCGTPRTFNWVWRRLLLSMHSMDIARECSIGPGLQLPHPFGIAVGANSVIGSDVVLHHNVTLGPPTRRWLPIPGEELGYIFIGDRVVVYPGAILLGEIDIGADAVIGAQALVTESVPPGGSFIRGKVRQPRGAAQDTAAQNPRAPERPGPR